MSRDKAFPARPVRGDGARETARRAADCALLGVLWFVFSLPLVTAGAAWLAVCEVSHGWSRDVELPLVRTFLHSIRHRLVQGLAMELLLTGFVLLPTMEIRIAHAARLPGAAVESALLVVVAAGGVAVVLLGCCEMVVGDLGTGAALRSAAQLWAAVPSVGVSALGALVVGVALVWSMPVFAVMMAGPVGFAVTVLWVRATRRHHASSLADQPGAS